MALKGEGNTFKLVSVGQHTQVVVARRGSRDGAALELSQRKQS